MGQLLYITGITGHTGVWFLKKLEAENYTGKIKCVVRDISDVTLLKSSKLDIEIVSGDLKDSKFLNDSLKGVNTVVHISSIMYSEQLTNAAITNNVEWLIMVHTTGRFSSYKSASEEYIKIEDGILDKRNQIGVTILRPTMIYGSSRDRNMYKLVSFLSKSRLFPMFGSGNNLMQPVHARDLGYAYYDVLVNKQITFNKEYNLSGKYPIKYKDLVLTVSRALGRKVLMVKIPLSLSVLAAKIYNALFKNAVISVEQVLRMQEDKAFSYEEAERDFGYSPISFEDGIKEEVHEYIISKNRRS